MESPVEIHRNSTSSGSAAAESEAIIKYSTHSIMFMQHNLFKFGISINLYTASLVSE